VLKVLVFALAGATLLTIIVAVIYSA